MNEDSTTPAAGRTDDAYPLRVRPDFIIAGAMKSGTTSIHHLLASDPRIFMPQGEVQVFSVDDIEQNPVFFRHTGDTWTRPSFSRDREVLADWHAEGYHGAGEGQVLGEDAPSYLASRLAIDRIARYLPEVKLVVTLRDPVERLHSQYWHWMRTFRAHYSLEETLQYQPGNLLQRSYYEEQLRYLFDRVPRERVLVILFEAMIADESKAAEQLYGFLGLEPPAGRVPPPPHANAGRYPRYPGLAQWRNRLFRHRYGRRYLQRVPWMPEPEPETFVSDLSIRLARRLTPSVAHRPAPMHPETRAFLTELLQARNAGLPDLLGLDLAAYWPTFQSD